MGKQPRREIPGASVVLPAVYPPDAALRKRLFVSRGHGAKVNLHLLEDIVRRCTRPGDLLLDPLAGGGSLLVAAALGRRVLLAELEAPFAAACAENVAGLGADAASLAVGVVRANALALPLSAASVDGIITSPPYGDLAQRVRHAEPATARRAAVPEWVRKRRDASFHVDRYGSSPWQLGNLRYPQYLMGMLQVYAECRRVLTPGGVLVVITANFWRGGRRVPLSADTRRLCEAAGLQFVEHWQRDRSHSLGAWQRLRLQQGREVVTVEDVQCFRREGGDA